MTQQNQREQAGQALGRLMELVSRLRAPDGCPWDRQQNLASVAVYLLEECHEAAEALEEGQPPAKAREELGDLLFQVVFLAELFSDAGHFGLAEIMDEVVAKMVRRHPHVFGGQPLADAQAVLAQWGQIKSQEREAKAGGLLDSLPLALPSLSRAQRLGQRAARVGFDWGQAQEVWPKVEEELAELKAAGDDQAAQEELGDVFFALAQWARHRGLDAEAALRGANRRFLRRFQLMEGLAAQGGQSLDKLDLEALEALWQRAKERLAQGSPEGPAPGAVQ